MIDAVLILSGFILGYIISVMLKQKPKMEGEPMEIKDNKPEELEESGLAVVTGKEANIFRGFIDREEALQEMMKNIENQYTALRKHNRKWWKKLREKYGLPEGNLNYNSKTREIRKIEE